jgi:hypothetical protein
MHRFNHSLFEVKPGTKVRLSDFSPSFTGGIKDKEEALEA